MTRRTLLIRLAFRSLDGAPSVPQAVLATAHAINTHASTRLRLFAVSFMICFRFLLAEGMCAFSLYLCLLYSLIQTSTLYSVGAKNCWFPTIWESRFQPGICGESFRP